MPEPMIFNVDRKRVYGFLVLGLFRLSVEFYGCFERNICSINFSIA